MKDKNTYHDEIASEAVLPKTLRFIAYTLLITFFTASLPAWVGYDHNRFFLENGPLEWGQFAFLAGAAVIFATATSAVPAFRELLFVLGALSAFAAIRELDGLFDRWRSLGGWKFGFVLVFYAAYLIYSQRARFRRQLAHFLPSSAFAVLWSGFIVAIPVAQLVGHGLFLQTLMGDDYQRIFKRVIEECLEFVGYLMLFAGSIETRLQMQRLSVCLVQRNQEN
jgi:hypothetical protein